MKIKLLTGVSSDTYSHAPGEVVDLEEGFAKRLIASGQAEAVAVKPATVKKRTKRVKVQDETR